MRDVIVIGGGVSGLACAHDLMRAGLDVVVLERQARVGGNARSARFGGYLMELGPTTMNAAQPGLLERLAPLGLRDGRLALGDGVRRRYLADGGRLTGISVDPAGFVRARYLSLAGRARILAEVLRPRRRDGAEESVHEFIARRFGAEFADRVFDPMIAGIFMGDSREISVAGAFPKLVEMEQRYGSIIRAVLAARRGAEPGRQLFSWPDGIGALPRALADTLGERVRAGVAVTGIARVGSGFAVQTSGGSLTARRVVIATQPHVGAGLIEGLDPDGAGALGDIPAPPVAVVFFGHERVQVAHPLDGLGYLTTRGSGIISGVQFASTMFPGRAPGGHVAISAYVGGARAPDIARLPADDLIRLVGAELAEMLGISGPPQVARVHHWPIGLPHYIVGHDARRAVLEHAPDRVPGLYLTGNYLSGVSVPNAIAQAGRVAERILRDTGLGHGLRQTARVGVAT